MDKIRFLGAENEISRVPFGSILKETREKTTVENEDTLLSCAINGIFRNDELFSHFRGSSTIGYIKVKKNDLILSAQNLHLGNANVNLRFEHGIISPAYKVYRITGAEPEYIAQWVKRPAANQFFLAATTEGASQCRKNIDWDALYRQPIVLPSSDEQKKIAKLLMSLDSQIAFEKTEVRKLKDFKSAMLTKMFPKEGKTEPEIRFPGFTDAWKQRKFEEIAVRSSVMSDKKGLPRVEYEDIISGAGRLNKDIKLKESEKVGIVFHKGDVLYGKLRPYLQNWLLASFNGLAVGDFWVLQPQNTDSSFLYRLVQSQQFEEVANQSTGTKMPRADWKLVSKTKFVIPHSVDEQAAIGTYFEHLDTLITLHQRKYEKLIDTKKAFLEKLIGGEK